MAQITAALVKELRDQTGAGMMECKAALAENDGNIDKAIEWLQIKGIAKAAKKADRTAAEGLVGSAVSSDGTSAVLIEVNCETDFVARNEDFRSFVEQLANHAANSGAANLAELLASPFEGETVETVCKKKVSSIGENISLRRFARLGISGGGFFGSYLHGGGGHSGAIVAFKADSAVPADAARELGGDISMHIAAMKPQYTRTSEIDPALVERETRVLTEQALESGKPKEIVEKMIVGRIEKWKKEICLIDQPFVKNPDVTIGKEVERVAKGVGAKIELETFVLFTRGEGIEKEVSNLAEEVAKLQK